MVGRAPYRGDVQDGTMIRVDAQNGELSRHLRRTGRTGRAESRVSAVTTSTGTSKTVVCDHCVARTGCRRRPTARHAAGTARPRSRGSSTPATRTSRRSPNRLTPYVVVDLWATWCGPCRMVSPALEQVAHELAGRVKLVKVDIDQNPRLALRFQVQAVPTLLLLDKGEVIARKTGAAPAPALRQWVEETLAARR